MYQDERFMTIIATIVAGLVLLSMLSIPLIKEHRSIKNKYESAIENNYAAYLDGEEIDISKVDTYNYVITIDTENECLYLTHKGFWDFGQCISVK